MFDNSRGRSSSADGLKATEGTEMAKLDRGADISDGGDPEVTREVRDTADRQVGLVMEDTNLHQTQLQQKHFLHFWFNNIHVQCLCSTFEIKKCTKLSELLIEIQV